VDPASASASARAKEGEKETRAIANSPIERRAAVQLLLIVIIRNGT
jgi:hypothetical protein